LSFPAGAGPNASETTEATFGPAFALSPILARTFREVADGPPGDLCAAERFPRHAIDAFFLQRRPGDKQLYGPRSGMSPLSPLSRLRQAAKAGQLGSRLRLLIANPLTLSFAYSPTHRGAGRA